MRTGTIMMVVVDEKGDQVKELLLTPFENILNSRCLGVVFL